MIYLLRFIFIFIFLVIKSLASESTGASLLIEKLPDATIRLSHQSAMGQMQAIGQYLGYTAKQNVPGIKESGTGYYYDTKTGEFESRGFFKILRGHPVQTKNNFDFKIEGNGFFVVEMPNAVIAFTHDGRFERDGIGRLVMRSTGFPVIGQNGYIYLNSDDISVNKKGQIFEGEKISDSFKVTWIKDFTKLDSLDRVVFYLTPNYRESKHLLVKSDYEILQGFVEQSSVEVAYAGRLEEWDSAHQANIKMIKAVMRNLSSSIQAGAPLQ